VASVKEQGGATELMQMIPSRGGDGSETVEMGLLLGEVRGAGSFAFKKGRVGDPGIEKHEEIFRQGERLDAGGVKETHIRCAKSRTDE
jgi:hypothetical protein